MARNYNELSGDEKFFDLLQQTLVNPGEQNSTMLFYVMLGLGFDGVWAGNRAHIKSCMDLCAEKARENAETSGTPDPLAFDPVKTPLIPRPKVANGGEKRRPGIKAALVAAAVFLAASFGVNVYVFVTAGASFRSIVTQTTADAASMGLNK
jgi:hypothetical protein